MAIRPGATVGSPVRRGWAPGMLWVQRKEGAAEEGCKLQQADGELEQLDKFLEKFDRRSPDSIPAACGLRCASGPWPFAGEGDRGDGF